MSLMIFHDDDDDNNNNNIIVSQNLCQNVTLN